MLAGARFVYYNSITKHLKTSASIYNSTSELQKMASEVKSLKNANISENTTDTSMLKSSRTRASQLQSLNSEARLRTRVSTQGQLVGSSSINTVNKRTSGPVTLVSDSRTPNVRKDLRIFNEAGEDVTPRPLLVNEAGAKKGPGVGTPAETSSGGTPSDFMSQASLFQPQTGTQTNAGTFAGANLIARSVFSPTGSRRSSDSISEEFGDPGTDFTSIYADTQVEFKHEEKVESLTEADLSKVIELTLCETSTMWLLDMPSICAMSESEEALAIIDRNFRYQEMSSDKQKYRKDAAAVSNDKTSKTPAANDRYAERAMNTFNDVLKNKATQTIKITQQDASSYATVWDMYDSFNENQVLKNDDDEEIVLGVEKKAEPEDDSQRIATVTQETQSSENAPPVDKTVTTVTSAFGINSTLISHSKEARPKATGEVNNNADEILQSASFKRHLVVVERALNLNTYQEKLATYRNFEILPDVHRIIQPEEVEDELNMEAPAPVPVAPKVEFTEAADVGPNLERLWSYQCPLTKGRNVSCIAWNSVNPDLVAIGYGQFEYLKQDGGLVCCWSLKNPEFPEKIYPTNAGVLSVGFSRAHPNLLAAGLYDGTIFIYNVCNEGNEPVLDSCQAAGKHTGPVWQLKWIEKERGSSDEYIEVLVSISTDSRVTQWTIRKGFESYDLMKLKKVSEKNAQSGKTKKVEAMISKFAGGLCFAFCPKDSNIYLVGTEDGHIHKCSCSYNEQYLDSYFGHTGPVYAICWSSFDPNLFISCGADWTIRLWHQDRSHPVLNLFSSTKAVVNLCWSPKCSTVFACVHEGALEVWDLDQNVLDPVLVHLPSSSQVRMSAINFALNTDCLLVGDSDGQVSVLQLRAMSSPPDNQVEILQQIVSSSIASQLNN